jgi:hypothetical protein
MYSNVYQLEITRSKGCEPLKKENTHHNLGKRNHTHHTAYTILYNPHKPAPVTSETASSSFSGEWHGLGSLNPTAATAEGQGAPLRSTA